MAEINITKENFENEVLKSEIPVLVDFWASWCGPCKMSAPFAQEIAREQDGIIKVAKVNVDEEPELANAFKINSIPTFIVIENGEIKNTAVGYRTKEQLLELLK